MKTAIIDLGSNSIRMNIVSIEDGKPTILNEYRKIVRLSENMGEKKLLIPRAIERTLTALKLFKEIIDKENITNVKAIGTAALRTAVNSSDFLDEAEKLGVHFEIITGELEAYYDYLSVVNTTNIRDCVIIDIGGASTELIYVKDGRKVNLACIPYAAVNLTEKFYPNIVMENKELDDAVSFFRKELDKVEWLKNVKDVDVVGLGGTIKALALYYIKSGNNSLKIDRNFLHIAIPEILKATVKERIEKFGIEKGREDIISGGVVPLVSVMRYINSPNLIPCKSGLREGVMYDIASK